MSLHRAPPPASPGIDAASAAPLSACPPLDRIETSDPDEFAAALRHASLHCLPMGATQGKWQLERLALGRSALYVGRLGASATGFGDVAPGVVRFAFRLGGSGRWNVNGREVVPGSIAVRCRVSEASVRLDSGIRWAAFYVCEKFFEQRLRALTGREIVLREGVRVHRSQHRAAYRLRLMTQGAIALAGSGAWDAATARLVEELITDELALVFEAPADRARVGYGPLIARCNEFLARHADDFVSPRDLGGALQLGERSLRRFFEETYGPAPARFLRLRRLAAVRRVLVACPEAQGAVTRAATSFGFYELGRFSADYRAVMGETPSETLRAARARIARVSESA